MKKIEFYKHNIDKKDIKEVKKVLKSIFLTTGPKTKEFEKNFASYMRNKNAIGVYSCTSGLFLLLKAIGIKEGDEVITTPFSFVATSNSILYCGAKPVFVDVDEKNGNIDINKIENAITDKTKAILPVHLYGIMVNVKKIKDIATKNNLYFFEDSAHCIEGEFDGIKAGEISDGAAFSFYATKNITSGEGGAIVTNNDELADKIRIMRLHGMDKNAADRYTKKFTQYDVPLLGYKFNMFDIQAALLLNQLKLIEKRWQKKKENYDYYTSLLSDIPEIRIPYLPDNVKHSLHLYTIRVNSKIRDEILYELQKKGIGVAVNYKPIHLFTYYRKKFGFKEGDFPTAEKIGKETISLPFYARLKKKEIRYIVNSLKDILIKLK